MARTCLWCKKPLNGKSNQKRHPKCKKAYENSLRTGRIDKKKTPSPDKKKPHSGKGKDNINNPDFTVTKPKNLNPIASAYWDKVAPILMKRGHLNVLSEDAFAELCDLHSRLVDIRTMIDAGTVQECKRCGAEIIFPGNRSLLQIDDKWSVKDGETQTFKESALSDLKRKYSQRFLDYCKAFYLTPLSNRGDFGLEDEKEKENDEFFSD